MATNKDEPTGDFTTLLGRLSTENLSTLNDLVKAEVDRRDGEKGKNEFADLSDSEFNALVAKALTKPKAKTNE